MTELEVLYLDNHLLAVNKPAGILTQPSGTDQVNLESLAKEWLKVHFQKPGAVFLHAVHRIDKPVSGIVLFARTSKALSRLQASMRDNNCFKSYEAAVVGIPSPPEGMLEDYLVHEEYHTTISTPANPLSKKARLHYQTLKQLGPFSLLNIELETGRYHQIRAQLSAAGFPIVGDIKYGSTISLAENQIALHHKELRIPHPVKEEWVTILAPSPLSSLLEGSK